MATAVSQTPTVGRNKTEQNSTEQPLLSKIQGLTAGASMRLDMATATGGAVADRLGLEEPDLDEDASTIAKIGGSVMVVARGIIVAVVALIVLGALYSTDIVSNPANPNEWTNMTSTFADYGTTAFTLIGVGLIAVGAGVALSYFGGMGGGGR